VLAQDYPCLEHIVVDGASTDGTVDILRCYNHLVWVSEPDKGQSDALNKGFCQARGEIIAGSTPMTPTCLARCAQPWNSCLPIRT
jgi:glycosyltransferase involved in cell wall biosynthesis